VAAAGFGGRGRARALCARWLAIWGRGLLLAAAVLLVGLGTVRVVGLVASQLADGDDFTPYWNGAAAVAAGQDPYAWVSTARHQETADYIYPPPLALLLAPLTRVVDYPTARWLWLALGAAFVAVSVALVWRTSGLRARGVSALACAALIGLWPSLVSALAAGTLSPMLLLAVAGAYASLRAGRPLVAGGLVALAGYSKSFPALLAVYLLLRGRWRACLGVAATGIALLTWTLLALGWEAHWRYLSGVVPAQRFWFGATSNVSLTGVVTRLLSENPFTTPVAAAPVIAPASIALAAAALLAATACAVWRLPADWESESLGFGLAVTAMLLVSPINGNGNLILAIIPLTAAAARVQADWPRGLRWLLIASLLLALPVEFGELAPVRAWYLEQGAQVPVTELFWRQGWGNLLLDGPFCGLIALWALVLRLSLQRAGQRRVSGVCPAGDAAGLLAGRAPRARGELA